MKHQQENSVRSNNDGQKIGTFFTRIPLRYRAALWLLLGTVLWLSTGSKWFLIAAAPAAIFVILTVVDSLLLLLGRRCEVVSE